MTVLDAFSNLYIVLLFNSQLFSSSFFIPEREKVLNRSGGLPASVVVDGKDQRSYWRDLSSVIDTFFSLLATTFHAFIFTFLPIWDRLKNKIGHKGDEKRREHLCALFETCHRSEPLSTPLTLFPGFQKVISIPKKPQMERNSLHSPRRGKKASISSQAHKSSVQVWTFRKTGPKNLALSSFLASHSDLSLVSFLSITF